MAAARTVDHADRQPDRRRRPRRPRPRSARRPRCKRRRGSRQVHRAADRHRVQQALADEQATARPQRWPTSTANRRRTSRTSRRPTTSPATRQGRALLLGPVVVAGTQIDTATASEGNAQQGQFGWSVLLSLKGSGQSAWADYTRAHNINGASNSPGRDWLLDQRYALRRLRRVHPRRQRDLVSGEHDDDQRPGHPDHRPVHRNNGQGPRQRAEVRRAAAQLHPPIRPSRSRRPWAPRSSRPACSPAASG